MPKQTVTCPKCQTTMEPGFIPDHLATVAIQTQWYKGEPEEKSFLGLSSGIKTKRTSFNYPGGLPITAYRCPQCTLVEIYAS